MNQSRRKPDRQVVVVVEDEALTRMVACSALQEAGYDVVELDCADAAHAHLRVQAEQVDAILADVHVPGTLDGWDLMHLSRGHWPWIVIVLASGVARPHPDDLPAKCRFLPKPYDPEHAVRHVRELLAAD
jgi:CheY-like chemotaxis protein